MLLHLENPGLPRHLVLGLCAWLFAGVSFAQDVGPEQLLLKDYRPRSIYRIPETTLTRARFPVIDMHSHNHAKTDAEVAEWVRTMDELNLRTTVVLSMAHGREFDEIVAR